MDFFRLSSAKEARGKGFIPRHPRFVTNDQTFVTKNDALIPAVNFWGSCPDRYNF
jgi:hypothetical protein